MAAHPNGKQHVNGGELVRRADAPTVQLPAPADPLAVDVTPETAWRLLYQELFDFAPDADVLTDTEGVVRTVNHAATEVLNVRKDFILGKPLSFFIAHSDWATYYNWLLGIRAGKADALTERSLHIRPAHGPVQLMMVHVSACADAQGAGRLLRWQLRPLTNREELERALRYERYFVDSVLETAQALVLVLDAHGRIERAGAALCALLRTTNEQLRGRDWRSLFAQRLVVPLELPGGGHRSVAWGVKSLALEPTSPIVVLAVGHDITELEEAQRHALQAERLAAIGQVTTALAHEARNMLQRIQGGLDRLSWRLQDQPEALEILQRVQAAQRDMTYLFDDVRSYAAPLKLDITSCDIAAVWREAWQHVLAANPGKQAELIEHMEGANARCMVDGFRIGQVFRNILENALAAAAAPVRVTVTCRPAEVNGRPALVIAFRDNGPGLKPEQRAQIFEPFYTTKPRGTGLGMAIAKRIVEAHGGTIAVGCDAPSPLSPAAGERGRGEGAPGGAEILITLPRRSSP